jgi:regulatory protein
MKALSLKMRAIALLAQREHSRSELRRKLLRIARDLQSKNKLADAGAAGVEAADLETEVDELLVFLQSQGYLSEARFVESRVHARAQRYGLVRIQQELAQHGLKLSADSQAQLKDSEFERALAIWQRRYSEPATDAADLAKQSRFLMGRGFSSDVVRRVLHRAAQGAAP